MQAADIHRPIHYQQGRLLPFVTEDGIFFSLGHSLGVLGFSFREQPLFICDESKNTHEIHELLEGAGAMENAISHVL